PDFVARQLIGKIVRKGLVKQDAHRSPARLAPVLVLRRPVHAGQRGTGAGTRPESHRPGGSQTAIGRVHGCRRRRAFRPGSLDRYVTRGQNASRTPPACLPQYKRGRVVRLTDSAEAAGDSLAGARVVDVSACPPGHNTPILLERSAPGSFKRLLGGVPFTMAGRGAVGVAVVLGPAL